MAEAADFKSMKISIDIYSEALEKLMKKLDTTTAKMIKASTKFDNSAGNILKAGKAADKAASKMQSFGNAASKTVTNMQKTGKSLDDASKRMKKTGDAADRATGKMKSAGKTLDDTTKNMKKAGDAAMKATGNMLQTGDSLKGVTDSFQSTSKKVGDAAKNLLDAGNKIGNVNKSLGDTEKKSSKAGSKVKDLFDKFKSLKGVTKAFDLADSLSMSNSKLNKVNDGKRSNNALHGKVAAAAGSSRSTYKDMAGYVASLSAVEGGAFKNNDQAIAFAELMQKSVVAGGAEDRGAAMNQMIGGLSKGSLGSDDLKAASGTSPLVMESLKSYTGMSSDDLYKMADDGKLTADVIKNAMFSMSNDINTQFGNTKMTFGETWDKLKEGALQAASSVLDKLNEIISNPQVQQFVDKLIAGMSMLGDAAAKVCDFIIGNWNIIGPILAYLVGVVLAVMIIDTIAMAAAWLAVNWPILLIIGALAAVIGILASVGVSFEQVCGAIGGFLGVVVAHVYNSFVNIWNVVAAFINFFGNAFNNPIASIKILFLDLAINALSNITSIAKGFSSFINKLTGKKINIAAGITKMTDALSAEKESTKAESGYKTYAKEASYKDYTKAALTGDKLGTNAAKNLENMAKGYDNTLGKNIVKDPTKNPAYDPMESYNKTLGKNTVKDQTKDPAYNPMGNLGYQPFQGSKNLPGDPSSPLKVEGTGTGGSMNVNMPDEDKEYLKNIAERDYIANVATNSLAPNISVQFGDVHQTADANKVAGRIKKILREQIATASEGVY